MAAQVDALLSTDFVSRPDAELSFTRSRLPWRCCETRSLHTLTTQACTSLSGTHFE